MIRDYELYMAKKFIRELARPEARIVMRIIEHYEELLDESRPANNKSQEGSPLPNTSEPQTPGNSS